MIDETSHPDLVSVPLARARETLRASRTLRPDRRFLLAVAELGRLRDGGVPPSVRISLGADGWSIHAGGERIGVLPIVPRFEDARILLRNWAAKSLGDWRRESSEPSDLSVLERQAGDPFGNGPVVALQQIESLWRRGTRDPRLFDVAGSATQSLLVQSFDLLGMTDALQAKAFALLGAREALSGSRQESAVFLACWMGYKAEADVAATKIPVASPIRSWVLDRHDALRQQLESRDAAPFARYLFLLHVADKEGLTAWGRAVKHGPELPDGLPLIRTALNASDFGPEVSNALALLQALEVELSEDSRAAEIWKELRERLVAAPGGEVIADILKRMTGRRPGPILQRFERSLEKSLPRGGTFWTPETAGPYYRSLFYSSLYTIGTFQLDRRASIPGGLAFAKSLEGAPPGPGELFQRWFSTLAKFDEDRRNVSPMIEGLVEFEPLGRSAVDRIADELRHSIPANNPQLEQVTTLYARHLDSRLADRTTYGALCATNFLDPHGYETYYGGAVAAYGRGAGNTEIAWAAYRGDGETLRRVAADQNRSAHQRWGALKALAKRELTKESELVRLSAEIFENEPDAAYAHLEIVTFLRERGRYKEAEALLRKRLEGHPDDTALTKAMYASRLSYVLVREGRVREAWDTIEPWIGTGKEDALGLGAIALDAVGRREEAWKMALQALERYPRGPWGRVEAAEVLWRQHRYAEVPSLYQDLQHPPAPRDWADVIAPAFRNFFAGSPVDEVERAFTPFVAARFNPWYLSYFADPFARIGRYDAAVALTLRVTRANPGIGPLDPKLKLYRYLVEWKSEPEALAWVRENVPIASRRDLLSAALDQRLFRLFWTAVDLPSPAPDGEEVWLLQATAAALDSEAPPAAAMRVRDHFTTSSAPGSRFGRFLLGLSDGKELLESTGRLGRGEAAYYLGIRELASGRRDEAFDWLLVCMELLGNANPIEQKARAILRRWSEDRESAEQS